MIFIIEAMQCMYSVTALKSIRIPVRCIVGYLLLLLQETISVKVCCNLSTIFCLLSHPICRVDLIAAIISEFNIKHHSNLKESISIMLLFQGKTSTYMSNFVCM